MSRRWWVWMGFAALAVLVAVVVLVSDVGRGPLERPAVVQTGDPERGRDTIEAAGCGACHTIPGVPGADATVGPPLDRWSQRVFIAGNLTNSPENLARWIADPDAVEPGTAMPDLGLSRDEIEDVVAYLFTLGGSG